MDEGAEVCRGPMDLFTSALKPFVTKQVESVRSQLKDKPSGETVSFWKRWIVARGRDTWHEDTFARLIT